jgi:hypothetical protein
VSAMPARSVVFAVTHPSTGMPNEQSGVMFAGPVATTDWVADSHRLARD